ncbi:MAG: hypothetical protein C4B59_17125 [Candidatus Methanogaster sp.]|uniref:Uncharacterized protein n=1 Tax=Candidatus Methanogaster sp. TaxID=3386292 RepID=A0AC61KY06_9EURY|nr:MAG: hypothetical protein C4B59_17125 [ANME-2 cluster archaeon]
MNSRTTILMLSAVVIAAVLSGCVEELSDHGIETVGPTPQLNVTPSATPISKITPSPLQIPALEATPPISDMTLSDYPKLFGKDVIIVIGESANKTLEYRGRTFHRSPYLPWMIEGSETIAKNLYNLTGNTPVIKTDAELTERDRTECNLILLGHPLQVMLEGRPPDVNTVITEIYESDPSMTKVTRNYPGRWKGVLELFKNPWNPEKHILIVSGSEDRGIKAALAKLEGVHEINETCIVVECESEQKEIHHEVDTTPALAGLLEPYISNITMEDIGFEVTKTDEVRSLTGIGKPNVPFLIKCFKIPGNSYVGLINVTFKNPVEINNIFIKPVQPAMMDSAEEDCYWLNYTPPPYTIDNETYASHELYPGREYKYRPYTDDRIQEGEVVVHIFPIQYIPADRRIIAYKNARVSIFYRVPVPEDDYS